MTEQNHLPNWLYEALILDSLPWEVGKVWSYAEFEERYTLHDSQWIGAFANLQYYNSLTLALIWDAHWIPDEIRESTSIVDEWPFLFIKLEAVESIITKDLVALNYQREVESSSFTERESGSKVLKITGDGGKIEINFGGKMAFLALDHEKRPLLI